MKPNDRYDWVKNSYEFLTNPNAKVNPEYSFEETWNEFHPVEEGRYVWTGKQWIFVK